MMDKNNKFMQSVEKMLSQQVYKLHIRRTNDFLQRHNKIQLHQQCTDIELECEGYSLFQPDEVFKNFIYYFDDLCAIAIKQNTKTVIHTLKLTLNGFKVKTDYIKQIEKILKQQKLVKNLKILWINTNDLENVVLEDFQRFFKFLNFGSNNKNFEDFSLQCSNWTFRDRQPNLTQLTKIFQSLLQDSFDENGERIEGGMGSVLHQRHIRLEISGWWYRAGEAKMFLGFDPQKNDLKEIQKKNHENYRTGRGFSKQQFGAQVEVFHSTMFLMISKMLEIMQQIEHLEIDMRNTHQLLQMKKLKQKIISGVSKTNRIEKSIISMRQVNQNADSGEKTLRLNIMM